MQLQKFRVVLTLLRSYLGTNPQDADIHATHIIEKERKLIQEKSKVNSAVNKYLDAKDIPEERKQAEINKIKERSEGLLETVGEIDERGTTILFRDENGMPCIGDHMIYGFMKAAAEAIARTRPTKRGVILNSSNFTSSIINQHVSCEDEFISFNMDI